jgi:hypothetical protein
MKYLKSAGEIVAFLVGVAGLVYLLGGLVIALRLLYSGFAPGAVATIVGQLPRQLVVTTALLEVALPAAVLGLVFVVVTGLRPLWKLLAWVRLCLGWALGKVGAGGLLEKLVLATESICLLLLAVILVLPAALNTQGDWGPWVLGLSGFLLTYIFVSLGWPLVREFDLRVEVTSPILRAVSVFAFFAVIALVPATVYASSLQFETAQVCTTTSEELIEGRLIGEGGGQVMLEKAKAGEQWVVNLPTGEVTKSEYGDISGRNACKAPSAEEKQAAQEKEAKAEAEIGPHGGTTERQLANKVRPYLFFDRTERWRPLAVDAFLKERFPDGGGQELCPGTPAKPGCRPLDRLAQLRPVAATPTWINIHGEGKNGVDFESPNPACHEGFAVDCNGGPGAAIYYRRTGHEGLWYWDFWVFYRYNDYQGKINRCALYCDDHEGDWEGVVVVTTESREPEVTGTIYAAHTDRIYVPAATLPTIGTHPLAYVAKGTHATYPYICDANCKQYSGILKQDLPDGDHGGQIAWEDNSDVTCATDRCVRALPGSTKPGDQKLPHAGGWAAWPGTWGATCPAGGCAGEGSSPRSPGLQARFKCPWVANLKALPAEGSGLLTESQPDGGWKREQEACLDERAHG